MITCSFLVSNSNKSLFIWKIYTSKNIFFKNNFYQINVIHHWEHVKSFSWLLHIFFLKSFSFGNVVISQNREFLIFALKYFFRLPIHTDKWQNGVSTHWVGKIDGQAHFNVKISLFWRVYVQKVKNMCSHSLKLLYMFVLLR